MLIMRNPNFERAKRMMRSKRRKKAMAANVTNHGKKSKLAGVSLHSTGVEVVVVVVVVVVGVVVVVVIDPGAS